MEWLLILGAQSDIAKAIARKFASQGTNLYLAHLNRKEIEDFARDVEIRNNVNVITLDFDAVKYKTHMKFYNSLPVKPDGVITVFGYLGDNLTAIQNFEEAERIIDINYKGAVSIMNVAAADFQDRQSGFIAGISSVAGDRGRQSNFIYGSAKAGFTAYLSGLRNLLSRSGVHVLTVKPGFVNTQMTAGMDLPQKLVAEPDAVAEDIFKAWKKKKNVIYTKPVWRYIMLIIIHIPEFIFKKLSM